MKTGGKHKGKHKENQREVWETDKKGNGIRYDQNTLDTHMEKEPPNDRMKCYLHVQPTKQLSRLLT